MKKILFLLLSTIAMYGQIPADATPLENVQITNNVQDNSTDRVNVPTSDGVINWKYAKDLKIPTKAFLSTGLLKNGLISINADPTKFNISAGIGIISNFTDPENPVSTIINFPAFTAVTPTYLTSANITYIAINSTPAIVMQASPFTPEQRRDLIVLGAVVHSNLTSINVVNNISAPSNAIGNQLHDFIEAVGALNLTGNKYSANGANLALNKSAGTIFKFGVNFATDWKNPHEISQSAGTALTFRYRTQNGTEGTDRINLNPALYDLNNVLTSVPNNKFTIQTVTMFQTGLTRIQYGQNVYDDIQSAQAAIFTRDYNVEANIKENGITRAYIIVKNNATSLQNTSDSRIVEAQKFGGIASGGVALTFANIVTALGYTPENQSNKTGSLTASSVLYPNNNAVIAGLATKSDDADVLHKTGNETKIGNLGVNSLILANNPIGSVANEIKQTIGVDDWWKIYGKTDILDRSEMVFEVGDNGMPFSGVGQRFRFHYDATADGAAKDPLIVDYNIISIDADLSVTGVVTASNGTLVGGALTNGYIPKSIGINSLGNSLIYDSGMNIGLGTSSPFSATNQRSLTINGANASRLDLFSGGTRRGGVYGDVGLVNIGSVTNIPLTFSTFDTERGRFTASGNFEVDANISATSYTGGATLTGTPTAPTAAVGTNTTQIATMEALQTAITNNGIITTSTSVTNATLTDTSLPQNGKTLLIANGASNINYTVNGSITASFVKGGTGSITFVQGSGRTMVAANGTLVFNGAQYSTASIVSFGTTDIVYINNF